MIVLVTGGSASGKSQYAEELVLGQGTGARIYIATMHAWDDESKQRIRKHRKMRDQKQFTTIECMTGLEKLDLSGDQHSLAAAAQGSNVTVLLECMSNLVANEIYELGGSAGEVVRRVLAGVFHLERQVRTLIVVTNEVFSDEGDYDQETKAYLAILGQINQQLAAAAEAVAEVVYGIPVWIKK